MAAFVEELVDDLVTQSIVTAKGTDAFFNELPDTDTSPATVVALQATGGVPVEGVPAPWRTVQCVVRSVTSWQTARVKAAQVYNRYHDTVNLSLPNWRVLAGKALSLPQYIGADTRGRYLVSTNFTLKTAELVSPDPLEITGFSFVQIGRTAATVQYTVNRPAKCIVYTRKETPLGDWEGQSYEVSFHTTHTHATTGPLTSGVWYHLYIYAIDADGMTDTYPTYPSTYIRFQTATDTTEGQWDEQFHGD